MVRQETTLVVTGASGRVGRMLRGVWRARPVPGLRVFWASRRGESGLRWDILADPAPEWPAGAVVVHLAGVTGGGEAALARNSAMVVPLLAACRHNRAAAILFASSAAVYAPSAGGAAEHDPPAPPGAYGRAKLAAERALVAGLPAGGMVLVRMRIGNVVGADALVGGAGTGGPVTLDPVPGRAGGPVRSWIGPATLARVLERLAELAAAEAEAETVAAAEAVASAARRGPGALPGIVNVASDPPLAMADLLDAAGIPWVPGPPNPSVIPAATLSLARLRGLCDLPPASAASLVAELALARGGMVP